MKYSRVQIEVMARAAGWGSQSKNASYVAIEESGGDASIVNSIGATGLMQINQPVHVGAHPTWTKTWLKNPINNLKAAKVLYDAAGQKWDGPWLDSRDKGATGGWGKHVSGGGSGGASQIADDPCADIKGPAKEYCERDRDGIPQEDIPDYGSGFTDIPMQLGRIVEVLTKGANWAAEPANWLRVGYVVGGGVLAIAAVNVVARPYVQPVLRAAGDVIPTQSTRRYLRYRAKNRAQSQAKEKESSDA